MTNEIREESDIFILDLP